MQDETKFRIVKWLIVKCCIVQLALFLFCPLITRIDRVCPFGYELFKSVYIDSLFFIKMLFSLALKFVEISVIRGQPALVLYSLILKS